MLAFKTYAQAPGDHTPVGIPLDYPWVVRECAEEDVAQLRQERWIIVTAEEYEAHTSALAERYAAWEAGRAQQQVEGLVEAAAKFGQNLIYKFSAENVLLGVTQAGMTGTILTILGPVLSALISGSLYEAIARARAVDPASYDSTFITAARILQVINLVEDYLGVPRSTEI